MNNFRIIQCFTNEYKKSRNHDGNNWWNINEKNYVHSSHGNNGYNKVVKHDSKKEYSVYSLPTSFHSGRQNTFKMYSKTRNGLGHIDEIITRFNNKNEVNDKYLYWFFNWSKVLNKDTKNANKI